MNNIEAMNVYLIINLLTSEIIKVTPFKETADIYRNNGYLILKVMTTVKHGYGVLSYDYNDIRKQAEDMLATNISYGSDLIQLIINATCYR
jgi:hypothetical protein